MKKTILFTAILCPLLSICQQNNWFIRPYGSVAGGKEFFRQKEQKLGNYYDFNRVYGAGLDVGKKIGQFYVSAGVAYQQTGQIVNAIDPKHNGTDWEYIHMGTIKAKINHLIVPVSAGVNVGWFFMQAGVFGSYNLGGYEKMYNANPDYYLNWDSDPDYNPEYYKSYLKKFNVGAALTIGVQIPVTKKIGLQLAADGKYLLNSVYEDGQFAYHLNLGGVVGIVYNFK